MTDTIRTHKYFWFFFALVVKIVLFCCYAYAFNANWPKGELVKGISLTTADTPDYYEPVERLLNGEGYSVEIELEKAPPQNAVVPWAFRMPGILPVYAPLYLLFGSEWGRFIVILLQFFTEILSVFLLAKICVLLFKKGSLFVICLILYVLNLFISVYTLYATSESFCISFLIISFYFLFKYLEVPKTKTLFFSGLFVCWAIFFRPTMVLFLPFHILMIWLYHFKQKLQPSSLLKNLLIFLSVFIVAESLWITRNLQTFNKFIPLNGNFESVATKQELALYKLIVAWGGDIQDWNPSEGRWFVRPTNSRTRVYDSTFQKTDPFRPYIFTEEYDLDSLKKLRTIYWKSFEYSEVNDSANYYQKNFVAKTELYLSSFKKNKPLHYFLLTKLNHLKTFTLIKRPYGLPFIKNNLSNKLIRVMSVMYYYFILFFGIAGMLLAWRNKESYAAKLFPFAICLFIAVHSYVGYIELRYLLPTYPIFTVYAAYVIFKIRVYLQTRKNFQKIA